MSLRTPRRGLGMRPHKSRPYFDSGNSPASSEDSTISYEPIMHTAIDLANRSDASALDLITALGVETNIKRMLCAALGLVLYELLITAAQSFTLFGGSRWNVAKVLFLINAFNAPCVVIYPVIETLAQSPSKQLCRALLYFQAFGAVTVTMILSLTLTIRVYALWNRSRTILVLCICALTLFWGAYISTAGYTLSEEVIIPAPAPLTGCTSSTSSQKAYLLFVTSITFETTMIILTVIKSFPFIRHREVRHSPTLKMLFEDGLAYYIFIVCLQAINLGVIFSPSLTAGSFSAAFPTLAAIAIACHRLLLRQQRALLRPNAGMTDFYSSDFHTASITLRSVHRRGSNTSFSSRDMRERDWESGDQTN